MDEIIIEGGKPLAGEVSISGAKNAALPMIAASILTGGVFSFSNVPALKDIKTILALISSLGADVSREDRKSVV